MSKKSYKRHQNRLYREIKRRILAEQMPVSRPRNLVRHEYNIETIKVENIIPNYMAQHEEFVKQDMARMIVNKLIAEGLVEFISYCDTAFDPIGAIRLEARLDVVRR